MAGEMTVNLIWKEGNDQRKVQSFNLVMNVSGLPVFWVNVSSE